ncbi:hypothetical protein ABS71_01375 [bacterium SCN 62-11]|nr:hypothetical protein [Candidatus Eremiobacteraeota bacterium]ODT78967.1 MAG: hypothetical protein ABS71_01375 [bacterium SCN 62-11]
MLKKLFLLLALTGLALGRPVQSPRGLCTFDVPANLLPHGGLTWGNYPGIQIDMREEYSDSDEMKPFILSVAPTTPNGKKQSEDVEVDGARGQLITRTENNTSTYIHLIVRKGKYNFGWSMSLGNVSKDEGAELFRNLRESIKFTPDVMTAAGEAREVRDPTGQLLVKIPGGYGGGGRKFSNGQVMIIMNSLREVKPETSRDWVANYIPTGYVSYQRRHNVEVGGKQVDIILAESEGKDPNNKMEAQMVLMIQGNTAVVLTFAGPARLRQQISLVRETVVSQSQWAGSVKKDD